MCDKMFDDKENSVGGKVMCIYCNEKFNGTFSLVRHFRKCVVKINIEQCQQTKVSTNLPHTISVDKVTDQVESANKLNVEQCQRYNVSTNFTLQPQIVDKIIDQPAALETAVKFRCDICRKNFRSEVKFKNHQNGFHGALKNFECKKCGKNYVKKHNFAGHKCKIEEEIEYCQICDKIFYNSQALKRHQKRKHDGSLMKNTNDVVLQKKASQKNQDLFECDVCEKKFGSPRNLQRHIKFAHKVDKITICGICDKKCYSASSLIRHQDAVHSKIDSKGENLTIIKEGTGKKGSELREFVCAVCRGKFYNLNVLFQHVKAVHVIKNNSNDQTFNCDNCGMNFGKKLRLELHLTAMHA